MTPVPLLPVSASPPAALGCDDGDSVDSLAESEADAEAEADPLVLSVAVSDGVADSVESGVDSEAVGVGVDSGDDSVGVGDGCEVQSFVPPFHDEIRFLPMTGLSGPTGTGPWPSPSL